MSEGYVLDFTDRTFEAFSDDLGVDIGDPKYCVDGTSKAKRMRRFLRSAEPAHAGQVLTALLDYRQASSPGTLRADVLEGYKKLIERLVGASEPKAKHDDRAVMLGRKFNPGLFDELAIDARVGRVLAERMQEAQVCLHAGATLAAVILSGSVLEGICLGVGQRHAEQINAIFNERFRKDAPSLEEWSLNQWIAVFRHLDWFSPTIEKFAHSLREFRNYIHPGVQVRAEFSPDHNAALIAFQVGG